MDDGSPHAQKNCSGVFIHHKGTYSSFNKFNIIKQKEQQQTFLGKCSALINKTHISFVFPEDVITKSAKIRLPQTGARRASKRRTFNVGDDHGRRDFGQQRNVS